MIRHKASRFNDFIRQNLPNSRSSASSVWRDHGHRAAPHAPLPVFWLYT
jgi:hypothetical protein